MAERVKLRDRPTADLVIIWLAGVVGTVVVITAIGVVLAAVAGYDVSALTSKLAAIINSLAGGIIGYVAGRGTSATYPSGLVTYPEKPSPPGEQVIHVHIPTTGWRGDAGLEHGPDNPEG